MRLPWQPKESDEPEEGDELESEASFEGDGDEPEADEPDEPQGLDALPAEARAAAEAYARTQVDAERAKGQRIAENARKRGFVIDDQGDLGVADYQQVVGWLAPGGDPTPNPQAAAQSAPPVVDDPKPDRFDKPDEYEEWLLREQDRRLEAAVAKAIAPLKAENDSLRGVVHSREAGDAMRTVREAVATHNPYVTAALDHPDFEATYKAYVAQQPVENLRDPRFLAKVAGFVAGELDPARAVPDAPRDAARRFAGGRDLAHESSRADAARGGPRESGPVSRGGEVPRKMIREEQIVLKEAQRFAKGGMTQAEWDASEESDYDRYRQKRDQIKGRSAGRR